MIVVDKKDMESLSNNDLAKLLRWAAEEVMRRNNDPYEIEDAISEALIDTNFYVEILHD